MSVAHLSFLEILRWGGTASSFTLDIAPKGITKKLKDSTRGRYVITMATAEARAIASSLLNVIEALMAQISWRTDSELES